MHAPATRPIDTHHIGAQIREQHSAEGPRSDPGYFENLHTGQRAGRHVRLHSIGYQNLLICDGAVIPANPGVNPSLTITAMAERAMAAIPVKPGAQTTTPRAGLINSKPAAV